MLFVDVNYANQLNCKLRNFKYKGNYIWNFSCPICGDSSSNKKKARCYIYKHKDQLFVKCHNCGYSSSFRYFLRTIDPTSFDEYVLDKYNPYPVSIGIKEKETIDNNIVDVNIGLQSIAELDEDHPVFSYVKNRKIPDKYFNILYYTPGFMQFVNSIIPNKFEYNDDHPRLIIPYIENNHWFAFQGRSIDNHFPKYYTIKIDQAKDAIYGLDRININKPILVVEGPIDSLFLPNAIAVSGSTFNGNFLQRNKDNIIIIYDNEPRSKTISHLIEKTINQDFKVCLFPEFIKQKDINEMILAGYSSEDIVDIIQENTYSGLEAKARFSFWKKC